ncbi:MAG TPA: GntR family transcriptional regulator [Candidatus Mediterraneibacter tabaqchaliae]|uniref:GntR family transcriptional regulator n=1 Tax=Candidatus Mediterraneibacter tabaqchaliae TaxID=2838689 RepID=A0A9D2R956_9FIRM|nr:GntR family transcriptional regulator [Candidatus Mediterraneibacter tabaqchaliae]
MPWNLDDSRPIYLQLMERIQHDIISGVYQPGDKLPSVRDLALDAAVNPNTMQKALSELERSGLVYSHRTSGRFITDDSSLLKKIKTDLAQEYISGFLGQMRHLGLDDSETLEMIKQSLGGENNEANP